MRRTTRLARLFTQGFRAMDIASPLLSFDSDKAAAEVRELMRATQLDLVGVRFAGKTIGYAPLEDLVGGSCGDCMRTFDPDQVLGEERGLRQALRVLEHHDRVFLETLGAVDAVVGRDDVQRPAARMWLFGIITLIEMDLRTMIEAGFPEGDWTELVAAGRIRKAEELAAERRRRGQQVDLLECLQFADAAGIVIRDKRVLSELGFESRSQAKRFVKELQSLRNNLAHTQDIVRYDWPTITRLADWLDQILEPPPEP